MPGIRCYSRGALQFRFPGEVRLNHLLWLFTALIGLAGAAWPSRADPQPAPNTVEQEIASVLSGLRSAGLHSDGLHSDGLNQFGGRAAQERGAPAGWDLAALMHQARVPGLSISVIDGFQIRWTRAYGVADVVHQTAVTPRTLFQAASISKPVMAIAAARLAEQGQMDLDAAIRWPLRSWLVPSGDLDSRASVTPRMLLSHTSGLTDGFGFPGYAPTEPLPSAVQILQGLPPSKTAAVVFKNPPMTRAQYSGGGSLIMQVVLEDRSGEPFAELMQRVVFGPLQMRQSLYQQPLPHHLWSLAASGHDATGQRLPGRWRIYPELAAAGLWTTSHDLATMIVSLQKANLGRGSGPLTQAVVRDLFHPVGLGSFALGFNVFRQGEGWYFAHQGANAGYRSFLMAHQTQGYGLVVMTNGDGGDDVIEAICRRVQEVYGWDVAQIDGDFRFAVPRGVGCLPDFGS